MKNSTYTPAIPANDRHIFSIGTGMDFEKGTIDLGYSYIPMKDRKIRGNDVPLVDGDYSFSWNIFALSYTRKF